MYFEATGGKPGTKAQLVSYRYYASHPHCTMSFWYFMHGGKIGSLAVKLKLKNGTYAVLNQLKGDQGKQWKNMNVSIGTRQEFEIIIEASRGDSYKSDIAIDDVKFYNCFAGLCRTSYK